ncbi:hypothetical protein [Kribbella alba]|uniref:hypothetical protein n=1 Tax=Kribbella alba TaxID=190197 RepID=UPI0031E3AD33
MSGEQTRHRRSERNAATQREILDAAWQLVREEPFAALAMRGVHGHGGGYHLQHFQAELLARDVRLIAPDQRGVLRSDPVAPGDRLDLDLLLEDFESNDRYGLPLFARPAQPADRGIDDLATDPLSVDAYRNNVPPGQVVTFEVPPLPAVRRSRPLRRAGSSISTPARPDSPHLQLHRWKTC